MNWLKLQVAMRDWSLDEMEHRLDESRERVATLTNQNEILYGVCERVGSELEVERRVLAETQSQLDEARGRLAAFEGLGPNSLGAARRLQNLSRRHPYISRAFFQIAGRH
jgi:hypothetical protein